MAGNADEREMSLGDHLEELRWRLLVGMAGPVVAGLAMLVFAKDLFSWLARPLIVELAARGYEPSLYPMSPTSAFTVYLKIAILSGLVIGLPWMVWQGWRFIAPGLHRHERRFVVFLLPGSAVLATIGVLFMYYIMLPVTLWFLIGFVGEFPMPSTEPGFVQQRFVEGAGGGAGGDPSVGEDEPGALRVPVLAADPAAPAEGAVWINRVERALKAHWGGRVYETRMRAGGGLMAPVMQVEAYMGFVLWLGVAFAIAFQLPLVMLMLGFTRLVSRRMMAKVRPYAILGCVVVAALLTPPDPLSQMALAIPMYLLYELGLAAVRVFVRERDAEPDAGAGA